MNTKTNCKSVTVYTFNDKGEYLGEWVSISEAARANNTTPPSVATGLWGKEDHFSVGRYWLTNKEDIDKAMAKHVDILNGKIKKANAYKTREKKIKAEKIKIEPVERRGNYIFIKSSLPGNECCGRCALYYSKEGCFPCIKDEGHENGYWRYSQPMTL